MTQHIDFDAAVVGGGPAGLAAALGLSRLGLRVGLVGPLHSAPQAGADNRTTALFTGAITLLANLGAWPACAPTSAPLRGIRLVDDRNALLKAPEVLFTAGEVGLDVFGWNVPITTLVEALTALAKAPGSRLVIIPTAGVERLEIGREAVRIATREGAAVEARLVVGADGRGSVCRRDAGISTRSWSYPQSAIACSFTHTRAHADISTEFHRPAGPFTVVPLPGRTSSLVWVERPDEARRLAGLDDQGFRAVLEARLQGLLGEIGTIGPRAQFPLSGLTATAFGQNRVALVGEAGHVIPPIGAQGLNLGLRDAAALADCVADALAEGRDIGGATTLQAYSAARRPDVASRIWTVDLLNRSLMSGLLPVHLARGAGLAALSLIGPLRRLVVREGLQPSFALPSLMQADGLMRLEARTRPAASVMIEKSAPTARLGS